MANHIYFQRPLSHMASESAPSPTIIQEHQDLLATVESELDHWRNILFTFTMDNNENLNDQNRPNTLGNNPASSSTGQPLRRPHHPPEQGTPIESELYGHGLPPGSYPLTGLDYLPSGLRVPYQGPRREIRQSGDSQGSNVFSSGAAQDWHLAGPSVAGPSTASPIPTQGRGGSLDPQSPHPYRSESESSGSNPHANPVVLAEEKRRRNTEASGKQPLSLNLEQTISELSGRAEELEKEAEDLRRENGWLKEIVIMKSRVQGVGPAQSEPAEEREAEAERPARKQKQRQNTSRKQSKPSGSGATE